MAELDYAKECEFPDEDNRIRRIRSELAIRDTYTAKHRFAPDPRDEEVRYLLNHVDALERRMRHLLAGG